MKALVLAAGHGTRLRPLTDHTPKVLLPVGGTPLLEHTLRWLAGEGVTEVVINLHRLGEQIRDFVGDGHRFGVVVSYSEEEHLLGTAGAAKHLEDHLSEAFVVVYGDVLTNMALRDMVNHHRRAGSEVTIAVQETHDVSGRGVVEVDDQDRIVSFVEKPAATATSKCLINAGIYVLEPEVLRHIEPGFSDFGVDVFPALLRVGTRIAAWRLRQWEYLLDIGDPMAYRQASADVLLGRVRIG